MKKIRIGCGAGCSSDRIEPAIELIEKGNLDYIVFECLAERTIADAQKSKLEDPTKGYTPMLEIRMRKMLALAIQKGVKIITNMGAANARAAVELTAKIAKELGIARIKIAMVSGDDITSTIDQYNDVIMWQKETSLKDLPGEIISANVYIGGDAIRQALMNDADVVITGRIADPALFVGPLMYEFGWETTDTRQMGQATLLGHLLECAGQLTGGYYADPGYKDVPNLHLLGFPIAEIDEDGNFFVTKVEGSGGVVNVATCKEQLLYEISNPSNYITPDAIVDFSKVTFKQIDTDIVQVSNGMSKGAPELLKVNIAYSDCFIGEGEVSFGGTNALHRARLAAEIIEKRLQLVGAAIEEFRVDYIGYNSLYKSHISDIFAPSEHSEIRLRISGRTKHKQDAELIASEVGYLYTNGPAGSSGITTNVRKVISIGSILIPRQDITPIVTYTEV
jgi:hypothetical protein